MANLVKAGARPVDVRSLRDGLRKEQKQFFDERSGLNRVSFLVPLGRSGLSAHDAGTERFANNLMLYGRTVSVAVEIMRHRQATLKPALVRLSKDRQVQGVMMGEPLHDQTELDELRALIAVGKDIDGTNPNSVYNRRRPTPSAMVHVAKARNIDLATAKVAVLGSKGAIGGSLMNLLHDEGAKPRGIDKHNIGMTHDVVRWADVVFSAVRDSKAITVPMLRGLSNLSLIVDATIVSDGAGGIVGSVDPEVFEDPRVSCEVTTVPDGVGLLTNAMVIKNLQDAVQQTEVAA